MSSHHINILAIIPCYNEARAISNLLQEFQVLAFPCDTLVVDDGSSDDSVAAASQFATHILRFDKNRGMPAAIQAGLHFARERGYGCCVQIDGDGQHVPQQIEYLLAAQSQSSANLVIGSRYYPHLLPLTGGMRRLAGLIVSAWVFLLFGRWLYDAVSGMRLMDKTAIDYFAAQLNPSCPDTVMVAQALRAGMSVREVRVSMRRRQHGASYLTGWKGPEILARILCDMLRVRLSAPGGILP